MIKTARAERLVRRRLPHEIPSWIPDGEIYFVTICARDRGGTVLLDHAGEIVQAAVTYHERGRWHLRLFVLMPDHVHLLVSFPADARLVATVAAWKSFTAKQSAFRWQTDFFEHRLRADESFDDKAHYLHMNPVRAGLCKNWQDWPYRWPR